MTAARWVGRMRGWLAAQRAALLAGDLATLARLAEQAGPDLRAPPAGIAQQDLAELRVEAGRIAALLKSAQAGVAQAMATVRATADLGPGRSSMRTYDAHGRYQTLTGPAGHWSNRR